MGKAEGVCKAVLWVLVCSAGVVAAGARAQGFPVQLTLPGTTVPLQGLVDPDGMAGHVGGMMYPAPSAAGFLVAVLTHAALNEGAKSARRTELQTQADKVLAPYLEVWGGFTVEQLQQRAWAHLQRSGAAAPAAPRLELRPQYLMTPDQSALVLEAEFSPSSGADPASSAGSAALAPWRLRVVAPAVPANALPGHWAQAAGEPLKDTAARLLARAVQVAWAHPPGAAAGAAPPRTIRFMEGHFERMERATVLEQGCGVVVLRTLRGGLLVAPHDTADLAAPACQGVVALASAAAQPAAPAPAPQR